MWWGGDVWRRWLRLERRLHWVANAFKTDVDAGFRHTCQPAATESDVDRVRRPRTTEANGMPRDADKGRFGGEARAWFA
jgi:hypothetical protein